MKSGPIVSVSSFQMTLRGWLDPLKVRFNESQLNDKTP